MSETSKTISCRNCNTQIVAEMLAKNLKVCPQCDHHHYMSAYERLNLIVDTDSFEEYDADLYSIDSLEFPEYPQKLERDVLKTGLRSEMLSGIAKIGGYSTAIAIGDVGFIGGTCGSVIGEKVTRCIERALEQKLPLVIVSVSGGMRMQEGTLAEPGARIGFAGPLAVASLREELPENFQKAESLLEHGFVDSIVHRADMRQMLIDLIAFAS